MNTRNFTLGLALLLCISITTTHAQNDIFATKTTPYTEVTPSKTAASTSPAQTTSIHNFGDNINIQFGMSAFPNPTNAQLTLTIEEYKNEQLTYQLYDMEGRMIKSNRINSIQTKIDVEELIPAAYFLKVVNLNKDLKTFKIIKY